jgi:hypothetical protein
VKNVPMMLDSPSPASFATRTRIRSALTAHKS